MKLAENLMLTKDVNVNTYDLHTLHRAEQFYSILLNTITVGSINVVKYKLGWFGPCRNIQTRLV